MGVRLLQSGSERLLEDGVDSRLLEGDGSGSQSLGTASVRYLGPAPNVAAHMLAYGRLEKYPGTTRIYQAIYFPGGGGVETSWQAGTSTNPNYANTVLQDLAGRVRSRRFVTFPTDWTWGNDTVLTRTDDMVDYAETNYGFFGPYHLIGASMGTTCALNWAMSNPTKVKSISCMLPAVDLQDIEDNNRIGQYGLPEPSSAYGGYPPDDHNPADNTASFADMPIHLWYSNNDSICDPTVAETFAAAVGDNCELTNIGNQTGVLVGHGLGSGFRPADVTAFIRAND